MSSFDIRLCNLDEWCDSLSAIVLLKQATHHAYDTGDFSQVKAVFTKLPPVGHSSTRGYYETGFPNVKVCAYVKDEKDVEVSLLYIACRAANIETVNSVLAYANSVNTLLGKIERKNDPMFAAISSGKTHSEERLSCVRRLFETFPEFQKHSNFYLQSAVYMGAWRIVKHILKWYIAPGGANAIAPSMIAYLSTVTGEPCCEHRLLDSSVTLSRSTEYKCVRGCSECAFLCIGAIRNKVSGSYGEGTLDTLVKTHAIAKKGQAGYEKLLWCDRRIRARLDPMVWQQWRVKQALALHSKRSSVPAK
jgi:hypothetical protein